MFTPTGRAFWVCSSTMALAPKLKARSGKHLNRTRVGSRQMVPREVRRNSTLGITHIMRSKCLIDVEFTRGRWTRRLDRCISRLSQGGRSSGRYSVLAVVVARALNSLCVPIALCALGLQLGCSPVVGGRKVFNSVGWLPGLSQSHLGPT